VVLKSQEEGKSAFLSFNVRQSRVYTLFLLHVFLYLHRITLEIKEIIMGFLEDMVGVVNNGTRAVSEAWNSDAGAVVGGILAPWTMLDEKRRAGVGRAWDWANTPQGGTPAYDLTEEWVKQHGGQRDLNYEKSQAFYNQLTGQNSFMNPENWYKQLSGMGTDIQSLANRSSGDIMNTFMQANQSQLMDWAGQVARGATSQAGQTFQDLARQRSYDSSRRMESQMGRGGMFSTGGGAQAAALNAAAQSPLLETLAQYDQMYSNAFQQNYGNAFQNQMNYEYNRPNTMLNLYNSQSNNAGNLLAQLAGLSQQQILAPSFVEGQAGQTPLNVMGQVAAAAIPIGVGLATGNPAMAAGGVASGAQSLAKNQNSKQNTSAPSFSTYGGTAAPYNPYNPGNTNAQYGPQYDANVIYP